MNEAKIGIITDPLAFRDDLNSSSRLLQLESKPVTDELLSRYADTERRIGSTTDVGSLERLHAFQKFLKAIEVTIDSQNDFVSRMVNGFNRIDHAYWHQVANGQKLTEENQSLFIRIRLLESALKKELKKSRELRGHRQAKAQTIQHKPI